MNDIGIYGRRFPSSLSHTNGCFRRKREREREGPQSAAHFENSWNMALTQKSKFWGKLFSLIGMLLWNHHTKRNIIKLLHFSHFGSIPSTSTNFPLYPSSILRPSMALLFVISIISPYLITWQFNRVSAQSGVLLTLKLRGLPLSPSFCHRKKLQSFFREFMFNPWESLKIKEKSSQCLVATEFDLSSPLVGFD